MSKHQLKTRLFGQNETLDDLTAEQEELNALPSEPVEPPVEAPSTEAPEAEPALAPQPEVTPAQETRADKRIRELLEERSTLQRQITDSNERWARLDERRKQVGEAQEAADRAAQQQREATERPDPSIDPVGARLYDIQKQNQELLAWKQQQEQNFAQLQQSFQQNQQASQFDNYVIAQAQSYEREHPDYIPVAQHGANARVQWAVDEIGLTPDEARQVVQQEAQFWARVAASKGKSFPQAFYKFGQMMGYKAPAPNGNGNGAPTSQAASNASRVLNQVRQGQAMQGLSRAPTAGTSNVSRYRDMSAAEVSAVSDRQWQRDWANPVLRPDMEYALKKLDGLSEEEDVTYQGRG